MDLLQIIGLVFGGVVLLTLLLVAIISSQKAKQKILTKNSQKEEISTTEETKSEPVKEEKTVVENAVKEETVVEEEKTKTAKKVVNIYHVSQNKDEKSPHFKKWRVRKQGSQKTIKYLNTQKEAIAHAKELAESTNGSVRVHKTTGEIRKA